MNTPLNQLRQEREQEGDNPFAYLRDVGSPSQSMSAATSEPGLGVDPVASPFAYLGGVEPGLPSLAPYETAGSRFIQGLGRGIVHPIRAFLPGKPSEQESLGFAGGVGEFVGGSLSFIPIFKGATTVLQGIGLLKSAAMLGGAQMLLRPLGRSAASVIGAHALRGTTAFAGFEAFAGDDISETPDRLKRAVVEGLAFEVGLAGAAHVWRSRAPMRWRPTEGGGAPTTAPRGRTPTNVHVDPLRLKLEYAMRPLETDTEDMVLAKLKAIQTSEGGSGGIQRVWKPGVRGRDASGNVIMGKWEIQHDPTTAKAGLHESFVRLMQNYAPGGYAIIPGLNQREVAKLARTAMEAGEITVHARRRIRGEDAFDLLVVDKERLVTRGAKKDLGKPSMDSMLQAIRQRFDDKTLNIEIGPNVAKGRRGYFQSREWSPSGEIKISTNVEKYKLGQGVSTLLHEFTHFVENLRARARVGTSQITGSTKLDDFFDLTKTGADQRKRLSDELAQATEEIETTWSMLINGIGESTARTHTKKWIQTGIGGMPDYFTQPIEQVSRLAELMMYNPAKAKEIAPLASRLVGQMIQKEAPAVRELMSREARELLDIWTENWRQVDNLGTSVWSQHKFKLGESQVKQWQSSGWFEGMRAIMNGKDVEVMDLAESIIGKVKVRHLDTLAEEVIEMGKLQRPLYATVARRVEGAMSKIDEVLGQRTRYIPVSLREQVNLGGAPSFASRRALIDTKDFLALDEKQTIGDWIKTLPEGIQEQLLTRHGQMWLPSTPRELDALFASTAKGADSEFVIKKALLNDALESTGHKGLVYIDNGRPELYVMNKEAIIKGNVLESSGMDGAQWAVGNFGNNFLYPDLSGWLRYKLRAEGVPEQDLPYFFQIAYNRMGEKLRQIVDPKIKIITENVQKGLQAQAPKAKRTVKKKAAAAPDAAQLGLNLGDDSVENTIRRAGLQHDYLPDGSVEIRDFASKTVLGVVPDEDAAAAFARELSSDNVGAPIADFPGMGGHNGGGGRPPRQNEPIMPIDAPLSPQGRAAQLSEALFFPKFFSALENVAKKFEHQGLGAAYTKIYLPAHNAMLNVMRELSDVKRNMGGQQISFTDGLGQVSKALLGVDKRRYPLVTGYIEALSKEEIQQAGGLMQRAMTDNELRVAKYIESVGLHQDVPRLMAMDRLIESRVRGQTMLERTIARMEKIELSPEAQGLLQMFKQMPRMRKREQVEKFLGLTDEEKQVIKIIKDSTEAEKDKFSIYAVSRYASAPALKKGFANGRAMYAHDNKITPAEMEVSKMVSGILEAAFRDSGLDPKRHLNGYWPHLRKWTEAGFVPNKDLLPTDVLQWVSSKYRSGELNVYETDPLLSTYQHVRSLYMSRHFDPLMPDLNKQTALLKSKQAHSVMNEYLMELRGKPHDSFNTLQRGINHLFKTTMGKEAPGRMAQDIVNALGALSSSAFIPYRPALIARNFFESLLKVSPRTGLDYYFKGLRYVTSAETKQAAYDAAKAAGAIRPGTTKLRSFHSAEDLFGPTAPHALDKYLRIFDKGFSWYQSADDWGRAIAFHAQRIRVQEHLNDFRLGKINIGQLKDRAKINTFDPLDAQIAERAILNGNDDQAINHLGQVLSRETMTRYGYADHPAGWNSVAGRLYGQFGTWPVQYKDYLVQGMTRGSTKDRIEFGMTHSAISGAIVGTGMMLGVNLQNWTGSIVYSGGPFLDMTLDAVRAVNGSDAERAIARHNLYSQVPLLGWMDTGNPRSVLLPGSYLLGDLNDAKNAMEDDDFFKAIMNGSGVKMLRPQDRSLLHLLPGL